MPVVGFTLKNVEANRTKEQIMTGNININSSNKIDSVEEKEISVFSKDPLLNISFEFKTEFDKLGKVEMQGEVYYLSDDNKKVLKDWQKNKKLPTNVDVEVQNFLFRKCLTLVNSVSENMELPPPINFPMVVPKEKEEEEKSKYIG